MSILTDYLARQGRRGDTELAHVTPQEKVLLESLGGAGTINPNTGLREYHTGRHPGPGMEGYSEWSEQHKQSWPHNPNAHRGTTGEWSDKATERGWETGEEHRERVYDEYGKEEGWADYGESDITSRELAKMSEKDRMAYFRAIFKDETDEASYHAGDYYMRVPDFDESGKEDLQTELSDKQTDVYENIKTASITGQDSLLSLARSSEASKRRGFASTGNPMIDRQRENIFQGMAQGAKAEYKGYTDLSLDIDDRTDAYYDDYMDEWETAGATWIDAVNV